MHLWISSKNCNYGCTIYRNTWLNKKIFLFEQSTNLILNMCNIELTKVLLYFGNLVRQCLPSFTSIRSTAHTTLDLPFATPTL